MSDRGLQLQTRWFGLIVFKFQRQETGPHVWMVTVRIGRRMSLGLWP